MAKNFDTPEVIAALTAAREKCVELGFLGTFEQGSSLFFEMFWAKLVESDKEKVKAAYNEQLQGHQELHWKSIKEFP